MKSLVTWVLFAAAVFAVVDWRKDWALLREWGVVSHKAPEPEGPYFEPMGISYRQVMKGLDKTFRMREQSGLPQPRFIAIDEETQALLEIRGEKENIGLASIAVPMPRVTLDPEPGQTEQAIGIALMRTFLRNTVPEASGTWLDGLILMYRDGKSISMVYGNFGRKIEVRVAMGYIIRLIVTKA